MDGMGGMKRISMAGSDVAVTEATIADLVLEYAMHLGRAGTTDIVVVPVPDEGSVLDVDLLIGPASQIVLSESEDDDLVETPELERCRVDLRSRIERITGRSAQFIAGDDQTDPLGAFIDFDGLDDSI